MRSIFVFFKDPKIGFLTTFFHVKYDPEKIVRKGFL
jgi:hypothetical protein